MPAKKKEDKAPEYRVAASVRQLTTWATPTYKRPDGPKFVHKDCDQQDLAFLHSLGVKGIIGPE